MYLFTNKWIFKVMSRTDLAHQVAEVRMSALDSPEDSIGGLEPGTPLPNGKHKTGAALP